MQIINPEYTNDATLLASNVAENDYPLYNPLTSYAINTTLIYIVANVHWVIRSLVSSNVGNIPTGLKTDTNWSKLSETNRWKMFDLKTTSQTYNNDSIDVTVVGTSQIDGLTILSMEGAWLQIIGKDQFGTPIYNVDQSLISTDGIYDPYTYFFSPLVKITDIVFTDLPPFALATYQVIISSVGAIVKCGTMLIGKLTDAGQTQYGMKIGITDYSIKSADEFGDFVITERSYSKNITLTAMEENTRIDNLINFLNSIRAKPVVWLGASQYTSSFIYGFYKDYGVIVEYLTHSRCEIEIEGLS